MQRGYDSRLASLLTSAEKAQITHISKIFSRDAHGEVHVRKTNDLRKDYRRRHSGLPRSF